MEWGSLEQLESNQYSGKNLRDEIAQRFYLTINTVEGLTFETACSAQETLIRCGYTYLEALYLLCGEKILCCSLLSKRTLDFNQRFFVKKELEELKEPWEHQLDKMIDDLDEKIFLSYLREDSERLRKIILFSLEESNSSKG